MRFLKQLGFIVIVLMIAACAIEQKQELKSPYPRAAKNTNRTVKVDLGGGKSFEFNKEEIDLEDYDELLKHYSFDGLDEQPKPIFLQVPIYPPSLKEQKISGFAEVSFIVNESGLVESLRVTNATHSEFAEAAAAAVLLWRFKPMTKSGEPTKVGFKQRIPFVLY
jgi:TonB family protein